MNTLLHAILLAAAAAANTGNVMSAEDTRPIRLEVTEVADGVNLAVIGQSAATSETRFSLEVESKGAGGSTTTAQSGIQQKGANGGTLLRTHVRTSGLAHWTARLKVSSADGDYSDVKSSAH